MTKSEVIKKQAAEVPGDTGDSGDSAAFLWTFSKKCIKSWEAKILESKKRSAPNEWKYRAFKFCVSEFPDGD